MGWKEQMVVAGGWEGGWGSWSSKRTSGRNGRQTPSAVGRVKVGFRGRVFLTGCKSWAGGWRPGFGGDECGALGRGVITGERKGVGDFPAL